jgi:hypothetical protein
MLFLGKYSFLLIGTPDNFMMILGGICELSTAF